MLFAMDSLQLWLVSFYKNLVFVFSFKLKEFHFRLSLLSEYFCACLPLNHSEEV